MMHQIVSRSTNFTYIAQGSFTQTYSFNIILTKCTSIVANRGRGYRTNRGIDGDNLINQIFTTLQIATSAAGQVGGGLANSLGSLGGIGALFGK